MRYRRLAVAVLLLSLVACESDPSVLDEFPIGRTPLASPTTTDSLVIYLVGTLTGPGGPDGAYCACIGEDAWEGAHLAVHELNKGGGESFELVALDDHGDPDRSVQLVEEAAASERTVGIIHAGPPSVVPRVERSLARAGIPMVMTFGDPYTARRLSAHVFQASPPLLWQARALVRYLVRDRGYRRIGAIVGKTDLGDTALEALGRALKERGLEPAARLRWGPRGTFTGWRRLRRARLEAVVVEGHPERAGAFLTDLRRHGLAYRSTARARTATAPTAKLRRAHGRRPRPQVAFFDIAFGALPPRAQPPPGTLITESYARGAHYLPVPSFEDFRAAFERWWDDEPLGTELRGYDAAHAIGWAVERAAGTEDIASVLEGSRDVRFGGLPITLGPDDHTLVGDTTIGLWVWPRPGAEVRERGDLPSELRFVPLQRGFSIDGERTSILPADWRFLFSGPTRPAGPAPKLARARFGVTTPRTDPVH